MILYWSKFVYNFRDTETIFSKENEVGQVDMRFKAEDDITLPDISEVYIGDKFYIFLQYKGGILNISDVMNNLLVW